MRVHVAQVVKSQIVVWARQEGQEIGGILLGRVQRSGELVRSVRVEAALLAEGAESVGSSIRFTPELLDDLTNRAKVEHPAFQVVGWFHTHNGLGAFFSSYDTLVHKEYFPLPWQIALVSDPELGNEGIYVWQNQELVPYEGESDAEWYSLIPTGSPRYRLVNPRRFLASIACVVILVAAVTGVSRWRSNSNVPVSTGPEQETVQQPDPSPTQTTDPETAIPEVDPANSGDQLVAEGTKYIVQPNDTIWEISRRFYGQGSYFGVILEHNRIEDPRKLEPGQELWLPSIVEASP